eukprot:TRINITY_DN3649_c0_g3_i3.p1 TRINITY_DN3649_c0_g3~~TRINITY_DN3649_c0_g3_i3.p1  ORF type:complete len:391 (-),score=171.77 TRINITY_DN3649_c0_g3_i3:593-1705(-)
MCIRDSVKTFATLINQDFLDKMDPPIWRSLIYTTCFMHSVVQERRKFGPLGWCVPYEFNNSDLEASLLFIEKYMNSLLTGANAASGNVQINFEVIKYMICEIQYGGRITDDLDRELFNTFGHTYYKDNIFTPGAVLVSFAQDGGTKDVKGAALPPIKYTIPNSTDIQIFREHIDKEIAPIDSPEVFGLHPNADLTFRIKESKEMINVIMETRPKEGGGGGGKSKEDIVLERVQELLATKVPPEYQESSVKQDIAKLSGPKGEKGPTVPLNIFLYQEIQRMQRVIGLVKKTLVDIKLAVEGQIIMTPSILEAINSLYDAKIPNDWIYDPAGAEISWLLTNMGRWFSDLQRREALTTREDLGRWMRSSTRPQ